MNETGVARYFFDIENGDGFTEDTEGLELAEEEQIEGEAGQILSTIVRDELLIGREGKATISVRNTAGHVVYRAFLHFSKRWEDI